MVKKGQPIGGSTGQQPRRGGMLPPSGAGPVEVTKEWLHQEEKSDGRTTAGTALVSVAPAEAPAAVVDPTVPGQQGSEEPAAPDVWQATRLPDPSSSPADQLAVCERGIHSAKAVWKARVDGATEQFIADAGPYLCWVHENKLYKLMLDNSGKPYRAFPKYLREQHDLTERTGYRITQTLPLLNILRRAGRQIDDLSSRQVDKLHPVRLKHGGAAVLKVWGTASSTMKGSQPTPDELEKAKQLLGLVVAPPEPDEDSRELTSATVDAGAAIERAAKLLLPGTVREAVKKDPDRVRLLYRVIGDALNEAGMPVE